LHYRDTFEALVVNNATLSNVQKFHYLIASLQDEAKGLISNLQITNENFLVAWQLLVQRYNNIRLISMMHAKNLCHIPHVKKCDAASLRALINHVSSHINALQALSLNVSIQDLMMNQLIVASLDQQLQDWEIFTAASLDIPTLADLITFLGNRCRALELIQSNQLVKALPALPKPSQLPDRKVSKHTYSNVATQLQCSLCNESHRLFRCDKFLRMQPRQRYNYAKQSNLCFNCLQTF
jgi:diphosphomevalonate decarboxylase